jgi:hypothetical protein
LKSVVGIFHVEGILSSSKFSEEQKGGRKQNATCVIVMVGVGRAGKGIVLTAPYHSVFLVEKRPALIAGNKTNITRRKMYLLCIICIII